MGPSVVRPTLPHSGPCLAVCLCICKEAINQLRTFTPAGSLSSWSFQSLLCLLQPLLRLQYSLLVLVCMHAHTHTHTAHTQVPFLCPRYFKFAFLISSPELQAYPSTEHCHCHGQAEDREATIPQISWVTPGPEETRPDLHSREIFIIWFAGVEGSDAGIG